MRIHLYLEEYTVTESGERWARSGKLLNRKLLSTIKNTVEPLMEKTERRFRHLAYFNDIRIFKLTWLLDNNLKAEETKSTA